MENNKSNLKSMPMFISIHKFFFLSLVIERLDENDNKKRKWLVVVTQAIKVIKFGA
jgi:hypothetical protein